MFHGSSLHTSSRAFARSSIVALFAAGALGLAGCGHEAHATPPPPSVEQASSPITLAPPLAPVAPGAPTPVPATFDVADLAQRVTPVVVNITTTQKVGASSEETGVDPFEFFFGPRRGERRAAPRVPDRPLARNSLGTGFIIAADGYVVTNAHVIDGADTVKVKLSDDREYDADIVGRDVKMDLALLKLRGASNLPVAVLGSSEALRVGEHVLAVGNPFGLGHTVTLGIVSAKARSIGAGPYDDFIQTDASINPGNSGGPLFDWRGQVIGINSAVRAGASGIGFAIPVDALKDVLPQLREKGFVERGKLGLLFQPMSMELAKALGMPTPKGALVADLEPGGSAERAGIKQGDVVLAVNGAPINHAEELPRNVARNAPGTTIKVSLMRGGKTLEVSAKLDALKSESEDDGAPPARKPASGDSPTSTDKLGFMASDLPGGGVRVDRVTETGSELEPGDIITEVNGAPVKDGRAFDAAIAKLKPGTSALVKVKRGRVTRFAAVPVPAK